MEDFLASLGDNTRSVNRLRHLADGLRAATCRARSTTIRNPSCKIYSDHWHCFGCGEHGGRLDWLMRVEGMTKAEAIDALQDWSAR